MDDLQLWLLIGLSGFVLGMVFALTLIGDWRGGPSHPAVMMMPGPPPATLESSGCASVMFSIIVFLGLLVLLFIWLAS